VLVKAHIVASKQTPPPFRNSTTLVGSARRSQKENLLPSAHWQAPPGTTCFHTTLLEALSVEALFLGALSLEALQPASTITRATSRRSGGFSTRSWQGRPPAPPVMFVMRHRLRGAGLAARPPVVMFRTLTFDGYRAAAPRLKVSPGMKIHVAAPWGALRSSSIQDAGLAALLLTGTWAVNGAAATPVISGSFAEAVWLREPLARWILIGICIAAVAVQRRWPIPALVAASLAALAQMALAAGPVPADLAVPVILYTIAARRRRKVSLALLAAALAVATAWTVYVALDGKADGWLETRAGRARQGGQARAPGAPVSPPNRATADAQARAVTTFGPTDWGGIPVLGSPLVVAWAVGWGMQSRRAYLGELTARARDLERERDQQAALAVAAERARITRELHDVVAHGLAVMVMQAQGGAAAFANQPADTLAALDTIVATGRASLADMRHVQSAPGHIDDPASPVPGLAQLPRLIDQVQQAGTRVQLHINGSPRPLPTGADVSSYRIVQEALTNTMKHAGPGAGAQVVVSYSTDELMLEASDDGTGESAAGGIGNRPAGNGLRGMRERATLLGGEVTAGPGPNGGYVVRARIPLDPGETA
jgi:signal transduction histidine kinase